MEYHGRILAHLAVVAVIVSLGIEQEIGDVHRDHQEQFPLAPIHRAVGTAEQQHQGRQDVEQRGEEDVEILDVGGRKPRKQE